MLSTKAEEAACEFVLIDSRIAKPTQRCHKCGTLVPKRLSDRMHRCGCGVSMDRDENAARTMLRWMIEGSFQPGTGMGGLTAA